MLIIVSVCIGMFATLVPSPKVNFFASLKLTGFELTVDSARASLGDFTISGLDIEDNDSSNQENPDRRLLSARQDADGILKLDRLLLPDEATVEVRFSERDQAMALNVTTGSRSAVGVDVQAVWQEPVEVKQFRKEKPAAFVQFLESGSTGMAALQTNDVSLLLVSPEQRFNPIRPFAISNLEFEDVRRGETILDSDFRTSLLIDGTIRFRALGNPLEETQVSFGETLRFENLRAELHSMTLEENSLVIRFYGTAEDVRAGIEGSMASVYPTLFDGAAASPTIRVIVTMFLSVVFALVGSVGLGPSKNA